MFDACVLIIRLTVLSLYVVFVAIGANRPLRVRLLTICFSAATIRINDRWPWIFTDLHDVLWCVVPTWMKLPIPKQKETISVFIRSAAPENLPYSSSDSGSRLKILPSLDWIGTRFGIRNWVRTMGNSHAFEMLFSSEWRRRERGCSQHSSPSYRRDRLRGNKVQDYRQWRTKTDAEVLIIDLINYERHLNERRADVTLWLWVRVSCLDKKRLASEDQSNRMTFLLVYHSEGEISIRYLAFVRLFILLCGYGQGVLIFWAHPNINISSVPIECVGRKFYLTEEQCNQSKETISTDQ